jgi:hypothetical protein
MPVEQRGDKAQLWVLLFDWLFFFDQFAKHHAALLKTDLSAHSQFSANCRCAMVKIAHPLTRQKNSPDQRAARAVFRSSTAAETRSFDT